MTETTPRNLALSLRRCPPGTELELVWESHKGTITSASGTITDYDPETAFRKVTTDDCTLVVSPAGDFSEIIVAEVTAAGTIARGHLTAFTIQANATEAVTLTEEGFEIPDYLVGFTGFLAVEDGATRRALRLTQGLGEMDHRLLAHPGDIPAPPANDEPVLVRPMGRPVRRYEIVDERTLESKPTPAFEPSHEYSTLGPSLQTVLTLRTAVTADDTLDASTRNTADDYLESLEGTLRDIHAILCPETETPDTPADERVAYDTTLAKLETTLTNCQTMVRAEMDARWHPVLRWLIWAREDVTQLQLRLSEAGSDDSCNLAPAIGKSLSSPKSSKTTQHGDEQSFHE